MKILTFYPNVEEDLKKEIRSITLMYGDAIRSVRKMTQADWLPSHAVGFSYRPASFPGKILELI